MSLERSGCLNADQYVTNKRVSTLEESLYRIRKQDEEITRLRSELTNVMNERDLLLCEVSKLKFELEIADLKRIHDDRVPPSLKSKNSSGYCNSSVSQECEEYEENNEDIDDDVDKFTGSRNQNGSSMEQHSCHLWHNSHGKKGAICSNAESVKHARTEMGYELSQDLLDKQIELLERKYGGVKAREAALTIQRAFRRYMLLKKFVHITAMAKAERRLNRRVHTFPERNSVSSSSANAVSGVANSEFIRSDLKNVCCNLQGNASPSRSLSVREKRMSELENGTNSLPRALTGHCTNIAACCSCNLVMTTCPHMCSSMYHDVCHASSYMKGNRSYSEVTRKYHDYVRSSSPQRASMQSCQQVTYCSKRSTSQQHHHYHQNSTTIYQTNATNSPVSTPVKKVPPEVPKRTSSITLRSAESPQATPSSSSEISFNRTQYSGSLSSIQSSSSDSSSTMNTSSNTSFNVQSHTSTPETSWGKKQQVSEVVRKRQYRVGLNLFNKKPEKGIAFLVQKGFLENSPQAVAKFLIARKGLSKQMIGEYLGNVQDSFNSAVLECFAHELDLSGMQVDVALRKFQTYFRMPGEAQKIERLMEVFSHRYCQCNRDVVSRLRSPDTVFVLAFAIIMLNTDLHTPNLKADKRMKLQDFIKNLRGVDDCCDIDRDMLVGIYERIKANEFKPSSDHVSQVIKVQTTIIGKKPNLALPHRRLVCYCRLYEVPDINKKDRPGLHQREVFLFNDLLVITKILSKKKNSVTYTFRQSFSLSGLSVVMFQVPHYQFGIRLSQRVDNRVLITFNARNEHDRSKFVDDIRESILEMDEMENIRIEAELERQKNTRSNRCTGSSCSENRDSGVADVEVCACLHSSTTGSVLRPSMTKQYSQNDQTSNCGGCSSSSVLKRSALSNSLLDIHDQDGKPQRRGSVGSLDSGMSVSFQSSYLPSNNQNSVPTSIGGIHHLLSQSHNGSLPFKNHPHCFLTGMNNKNVPDNENA